MDARPERSEPRSSDAALLDLLRVDGTAGIGEIATALGVTATAVRQRLDRLVKAGLVTRMSATAKTSGRGRPAHRYGLTPQGKRSGGDNFRDLALVLWREIRGVREPAVRRGLLNRVGQAMAEAYRERVTGPTPEARLRGVAELLRDRRLSCTVDVDQRPTSLPVLTAYTCPYPELAEQDRGICAAEREMIEQLVGVPVKLSDCRLDGGSCCRFTADASVPAADSSALETYGVGTSNALRFIPSSSLEKPQ